MDTQTFPPLVVPQGHQQTFSITLQGPQWTGFGRDRFAALTKALGFTVEPWPTDYKKAQTWARRTKEQRSNGFRLRVLPADASRFYASAWLSRGAIQTDVMFHHNDDGSFYVSCSLRAGLFYQLPEAEAVVSGLIGTVLRHPTVGQV